MVNQKLNTEYLYLDKYLYSVFNNNPLIVYTPNDKLLIEKSKADKQKELIIISNEIITGNFRMIDSCFPEILANFFLNNLNEHQPMKGVINKMANKHFIYQPKSFAKRVIGYRFIDMIRAILFSDFFTKVWDGQYINNRIFVRKDNITLKYFTFYEATALAKEIIDNITLEPKVVGSINNCLKIELMFNYSRKQ